MKTVLVVLCFVALVYSAASLCVSCKYATTRDQCKDAYMPPVPEANICDAVIPALCKKYGDYAVYCQTAGSANICKQRGKCGGHGNGSRMSSCLVLIVTTIAIAINIGQ